MNDAITKIVFIDMDGPFCNFRAFHGYNDPDDDRLHDQCDPVAVEFLNRLYYTDPDHTRIVMNSSWKDVSFKTREYCIGTLESEGFTGKFHDDWKTPQTPGRYAGDARAWLDNHADVTRYILINDYNDCDGPIPAHAIDHYKPFLGDTPPVILTSTHNGLLFQNMRDSFQLLHDLSLMEARPIWQKNRGPK